MYMYVICWQLRLVIDKGHVIENVYMGKTSYVIDVWMLQKEVQTSNIFITYNNILYW